MSTVEIKRVNTDMVKSRREQTEAIIRDKMLISDNIYPQNLARSIKEQLDASFKGVWNTHVGPNFGRSVAGDYLQRLGGRLEAGDPTEGTSLGSIARGPCSSLGEATAFGRLTYRKLYFLSTAQGSINGELRGGGHDTT